MIGIWLKKKKDNYYKGKFIEKVKSNKPHIEPNNDWELIYHHNKKDKKWSDLLKRQAVNKIAVTS